jgi:hypothetical protein
MIVHELPYFSNLVPIDSLCMSFLNLQVVALQAGIDGINADLR